MAFSGNKVSIQKIRSSISVDSPRCIFNVLVTKENINISYEDFSEKFILLSDLLDIDLRGTVKSLAKSQNTLPPRSVIPLLEAIDPKITIIYKRLCWIESKNQIVNT